MTQRQAIEILAHRAIAYSNGCERHVVREIKTAAAVALGKKPEKIKCPPYPGKTKL